MKILRDRKLGTLKLCQKGICERVLECFKMHGSKPVSTPLAAHSKLFVALSPNTNEERDYMSRIPYASAIGIIIYAMVCTRPDISQSIGVVTKIHQQSEQGTSACGEMDTPLSKGNTRCWFGVWSRQ